MATEWIDITKVFNDFICGLDNWAGAHVTEAKKHFCENTNRVTRNVMPKPSPFEAWNSSHNMSTLPTVAIYGLPPPSASPLPYYGMRPTLTHHAMLVTRAGATRMRGGRSVNAHVSSVTPHAYADH